MTTGLPSDEVAEDYKNSLEDLTLNSRYEISNLTVIAKENMDHALAISRVIETHIRNAPPNRKLPALYVLDSVVKNVGTPYTLFFGRNLFQTFMNAYTLVDGPIRKKLEEMLKTWKEPVPGSLDTRPVFPIEVTRTIENALIKARTAAVQLQQQQAKTMQGRTTGTWKSAPTPPPGASGPRYNSLPAAQSQGYAQQQSYLAGQGSVPQTFAERGNGMRAPSNMPQANPYPPQFSSQPSASSLAIPDSYGQPAGSLEALHSDLSNLTSLARTDFAANPYDQSLQQRLKALLDLQTILQSQHLPPDQVQLIREQVSQLSQESQPVPLPASAISTTSYSVPHVPAPAVHEPVPQIPPSLQSLLPANALAALLATVTGGQSQSSLTPPPTVPAPQPYIFISQPPSAPALASAPVPAPAPAAVASQPPDGSSLLASLRAAGVLPKFTSSSPDVPAIPVMSISSLLPTPLNMGARKQDMGKQPQRDIRAEIPRDLQLTSSSIKIPHPELLLYLYEAQPNQCSTCGRRFLATDEGKKRKARHLDWHFKVNIRMADAAKRGQNRSWYVDEMEWIKSHDDDEENSSETTSGAKSSAGVENGALSSSTPAAHGKAQGTMQQWIPVPTDGGLTNISCPICQERFETVWHDEAQEWVWMDAIKVGERVYHASCHTEASRSDGGHHHNGTVSSASRNLTPDPPILGKRKADRVRRVRGGQ